MPAALAERIAIARARPPLRGPVVLYGAGGKGARTLRFLAGEDLEVAAVLDSHARPGQSCAGRPVHRPAQWRERHAPGDFELVVAIHNPGVDLGALARELATLGFRRMVLPVELHQIFAGRLAPDYFLGPAEAYLGKEREIGEARALLADDASRAWFDAALGFRLGGDYGTLPAPSPRDQYVPGGLPRWREPMRLADCGAYDGDSLRMFQAGGYRVAALAAFEADAANFRRLQAAPGLPAERLLFACAVGASSGELRFAAGRGGSSRVDAVGDATVRCERLDDVLADFRPTLVKMDVEGAEHDALCGAAQLIARERPGLAVSAYHSAEDLWRLARLIGAWDLDYRLYLRGHAHSTFDLVLYAMNP